MCTLVLTIIEITFIDRVSFLLRSTGSPFTFRVKSKPDASKVRVTGPGVEDGVLTTYVSSFIVETTGAGAGQLTVRIRGPKGTSIEKVKC